ncbi:hypothetical protein HY213_05540, partial [Candidatus Peregrinibacteria bacterium]|nr:hypothetical protein [Candidatus Peregrinibacteria bacterium]
MPLPVHTIRCLSLRVIAPDVYEVVFTKPEGFSFRAGQFVLFDVPLIENRDDIQTRAFSI